MRGKALESINPAFQRLAIITGTEKLKALERKRVLVFGIGGVGSWAAEALARSDIGCIALVDSDKVCITNINRQSEAFVSSLGKAKVEALRERLLDINPRCTIETREEVYSRENSALFGIEEADYVIDAIDSLSNKLDLIEACARAGVRVYSSMGMAGKLDPTCIKTADIWQTHGCALARLVRQGLKKRGFSGSFTAVYSAENLPRHDEIPVSCGSGACFCSPGEHEWCSSKKIINGSSVMVTAAAGMVLASLVIRDITGL
ncbi:MAG: tRNA threonylcarbamoyladenosine dehydratase [Treponema sp.]|nr:tRNA threonylcarbamoyladenosine dehydratase [Treponema sp.]